MAGLMTGVEEAIKQHMAQKGICNYSVRSIVPNLTDGYTLPAGKYYFINLADLTNWFINANNVVWNCATDLTYTLAYQCPIFQGQVHFIKNPEETVADTRVMIIEITPVYESRECEC